MAWIAGSVGSLSPARSDSIAAAARSAARSQSAVQCTAAPAARADSSRPTSPFATAAGSARTISPARFVGSYQPCGASTICSGSAATIQSRSEREVGMSPIRRTRSGASASGRARAIES